MWISRNLSLVRLGILRGVPEPRLHRVRDTSGCTCSTSNTKAVDWGCADCQVPGVDSSVSLAGPAGSLGLPSLNLRPRVAQRYRSVKNQTPLRRVRIDTKISLPFELIPCSRLGIGNRRLHHAPSRPLQRVRVQVARVGETRLRFVRILFRKQVIIQPNLRFQRVSGRTSSPPAAQPVRKARENTSATKASASQAWAGAGCVRCGIINLEVYCTFGSISARDQL